MLVSSKGSLCCQWLGLQPLLFVLLSREPGGSGTPVRAGAGAGMWLWEEQGGLIGPFSFLLVLLLLMTRSPLSACLFTGSLYLLLRVFSFEPVPSRRALQVLMPRDRVSAIAHRGGSHDAPENTLAAIRQVSPADLAASPTSSGGSSDLCLSSLHSLLICFPMGLHTIEFMQEALEPSEGWKTSQPRVFIEHTKCNHICHARH